MSRNPNLLIADVESYLLGYLSLDPDLAFVLALWAASTYCWQTFDAFPYLVITAMTKRSGKTRCSELLQFLASNPRSFVGMTTASLFQSIDADKPVLFVDEAETLSRESSSNMRAILNGGYRRGATVPRGSLSGEIQEYSTYCPKVFVLIGDVYDTLRDRSIVISMERGTPPIRFLFADAKRDGNELGGLLKAKVDAKASVIEKLYRKAAPLEFLSDREEELWQPLFAVCRAIAPQCLDRLQQVAVDTATMKTADARKFSELTRTENKAADTDYAERLVKDLYKIFLYAERLDVDAPMARDAITSTQAVGELRSIATAPWRRYQGSGLTPIIMARLLGQFGLKPTVFRPKRTGKEKREPVKRGYRFEDVEAIYLSL